jgi:hemerythrin-like domain-containing protein/nucleotide-binding universal stress UspA family protein
MYRHLLVPVDGTDLSIELVGNAVGLARQLGARVTFFHLLPDDDALHRRAPSEPGGARSGRARELLAKAQAAARACGVPCTALTRLGDRLAAAIVDAARDAACDLIVMASHGAHDKIGMALASDTMDVLMRAGLPVLVTATGELTAPARAIGVLRDEHRSLAAVLQIWLQALSVASVDARQADPELMQAIVRYLQQFPVALHHPKEEEFLFCRLRERAPSLDAELDELERQHARDRQWVADLALRVDALIGADEAGRKDALALLADAVSRYAEFTWDHLGREEGVILPAAQRHLNAADWSEIDAAFSDREGLRFATETEEALRRQFVRIVGPSALAAADSEGRPPDRDRRP